MTTKAKLAAAALLIVVILYAVATRYEIQHPGGILLKVDRWTGAAYRVTTLPNGTREWVPVAK